MRDVLEEKLIKYLSEERKRLGEVLKLITSIRKLSSEPMANLKKLKNLTDRLESYQEVCKFKEDLTLSLQDYIKILRDTLAKLEEKFWVEFGDSLETAVSEIGLEVRGHYPLLELGLYTLELDKRKMRAIIWYGPQFERLSDCHLDTKEVIKVLRRLNKDITEREFNEERYMKLLYEAYELALTSHGLPKGSEVPILDVLFFLAILLQPSRFRTNPIRKNFKEYGKVFFSYDLYRLNIRTLTIDGREFELSLRTATRMYTRTKSYLWVPTDLRGEGMYISHLRFKEVA